MVSAPRVIAVTGGKGGVGKTLTTANLGLCLSRMGMRTLLVDGDFGLANLDVMFNIYSKYTIDDVLSGEKSLREILVSGPEGVTIAPSASGILKVSELNQIQKLVLLDQFETLDHLFDIILIDTAAGLSSNVKFWTTSAAEIMVITTPEPTSLADAYATIKVLHQTTGECRFRVVVNMAGSADEASVTFQRLERCAEIHLPDIQLDYLGSVPFLNADLLFKNSHCLSQQNLLE